MSEPNKSIPWFLPSVGVRDQELVAEVIASNYINDGDVTRRLEDAIAQRVGVAHCVAVTSGTAAITLALMGLGVGPGDEVIVPDLTFIATANAVRLTGASVVLVDVEPTRLTIDVDLVAKAIGPRTRAVVPVDVNGRGCDYRALEALCKAKNILMVCDAAEALGSAYDGQMLGSFGDAGCFSFSPNKTVTCGQGGMIATDSEDLVHRLRELKDQGRRQQGTGGDDLHPVVGYNFKLTNIQAAVGLAQLEKLDARLNAFGERDAHYAHLLSECKGVTMPPKKPGEVLQWTDILVENRNVLVTALNNEKMGNRPFWFPLHTQAPYAECDDKFPRAIQVSRCGLWLPSHFDLSKEDIERTCRVILEHCG